LKKHHCQPLPSSSPCGLRCNNHEEKEETSASAQKGKIAAMIGYFSPPPGTNVRSPLAAPPTIAAPP